MVMLGCFLGPYTNKGERYVSQSTISKHVSRIERANIASNIGPASRIRRPGIFDALAAYEALVNSQ